MALTLAAKAPAAVYRYSWEVPLADGDAIASYTLTATGCTIVTDSQDGTNVIILISGGTAGTTATIEALVTTGEGEEIPETIYLPIVASTAGTTARDICEFALRKVYGKDETPEASAMTDAIERLDDMLRGWAVTGADVGATFPLAEATTIYCPPQFVSAIKANLLIQVADLYDVPITPVQVENARRGLQLVKASRLPTAEPVYY
jgi:hypothetical protein